MKIKKFKFINNNNKLIELQLLKSQIYKKNFKFYNNQQLYIKKIINIIYEFHISNKKILFINFPKKFQIKITKKIKNNQHIFINNEKFLTEIFNNQQKFIKNNFKNKIPINKLIHLIIIFNPLSLLNYDKKSYIFKIPTITIGNNKKNKLNFKQNYKLIGNYKFIEKKINNNIFFSILKVILKK